MNKNNSRKLLMILALILIAASYLFLYPALESSFITAEPASAQADVSSLPAQTEKPAETTEPDTSVSYTFRSKKQLESHYEKHGMEMGFENSREYEEAASRVINDPAALHKTEKEDGDDVYYLEETNEFVILSTDGYIRTYFYPSDGIRYYNRQ